MYCGRGRVEMVNRSCVIIKMLWLAEVAPVRGDDEKQTAESERDARHGQGGRSDQPAPINDGASAGLTTRS
jgi:hypothetical protein